MKLAEALILRAAHQRRIEQLKQRLVRNAKVQEGERPAEDPASLIDQLERTVDDLVVLIRNINQTNISATLNGDQTLTDALAVRDGLEMKYAAFRELAKAGTVTQDRYSKSEVKFKATVDVTDMQKRADDLAKERRELDARIQEANWKTDLSE